MNSVLIEVIKKELDERNNSLPEEPIFVNKYGTRYRKMRKALKTACENARVRHCTHHSLRHAYATIARQRRTDIGTISKLLGHTNPTITQNIYIHWRDEEVHQAAQRIKILQKSSKSGK